MITVRGGEDVLGQALEVVAVEIEGAGFEFVVVADERGVGLRPALEVEGDKVRKFGGAAEEVFEFSCLAGVGDVRFRSGDGELAQFGALGADLVELALFVTLERVELWQLGRSHATSNCEHSQGFAMVSNC